VVQLSLDSEKLAKTNSMLAGDGIKLEFSTKGGKFAGLDNLFAQLDKLKGIDSDVKRIAAMKKLFGDDSETHQVLNTMMEKGLDGYREVVAKMQAQADLRKRVDEQLKTVSAAAEAAQGSFTNMLKDMGATIAPDLVLILNKLGALANSIGAWTRENQAVVKWGLRLVGFVSVLAVGVGALGLSIASVLGPLMITRFLMARLALSMGAARTAATAAGPDWPQPNFLVGIQGPGPHFQAVHHCLCQRGLRGGAVGRSHCFEQWRHAVFPGHQCADGAGLSRQFLF
jgi:hypothetical protein